MENSKELKKLTKDFFNRHPIEEFSAARIQYSLLLMPDVMGAVERAMPEIAASGIDVPDYTRLIDRVNREEDTDNLLRMLREGLPGHAKERVIQKLLEREEEALPEVQRLVARSFSDHAIESCTTYLVRCKTDCSKWIIQQYGKVREPYAQSLLCLVLGFRAKPDAIPFLIEQMERFEKQYPDETFDQGPLLALYEIRSRFKT